MTAEATEYQMECAVTPLAIPRWQWRTVAPDLSSLFHRLPAPHRGAGRQLEETHLICLHSSHSAVLSRHRLQLRWRKEIGPEGLEIWDTILDVTAPFPHEAIARLWTAWALERPVPATGFADAVSFLEGAVAMCPEVVPVRTIRECSDFSLSGIDCSMERIAVATKGAIDSFAVEHEDPTLMVQILADLGLQARDNINLLQGLRSVLGLTATTARI